MSPDSKTSRAFLLLIAFSLTVGTAAADPSVEIDDGDQIIWEQSPDQTVNADVTCGDSRDVESVEIQREYYEPFEAENDGGEEYYHDMSSRDAGIYNVTAYCSGDKTASDTFVVDELDFDVSGVREGDTWYVGFDESMTLEFSSEVGSFENSDLGKLDVSLGGENIYTRRDNFNELQIDINGEKFEEILSESEDRGDKYLVFDVIYDRDGDENHFSMKVNRSIELNKWRVADVNINPDDSVTVSQFNQLNLDASIYYKGDPVDDAGSEDFYLEDRGSEDEDGSQWFDGELVDPEKGRYSISLGPTPKDLDKSMKVMFESSDLGGPVEVAEINVENIEKFLWATKVLTPDQGAVEADFRVNYPNSYVNFTSTNGDFSEKIRPGEHDLEVEFPTSRLSLSEVELNEENSGRNILYNYVYYSEIGDIQDPDNLEGIKPVNLASYSFAYPFEDGSLEMRFNNEQMDSSESVKVFECTQWHFGDKECKSGDGWDQVDDVTTVPASWKSTKYSTAKFSIQPHNSEDNGDILQNAYIVGTSADLLLNNEINVKGADGGRVETGGDIKVSGRIASENDNFVGDAEVEVSFYDGDTEVRSFDTVTTGSEGRFSVDGEAPAEPGNYSIRLDVSADNYNDLETEMEDKLEVFIAEGVDLDVESPLEVKLGHEVSTTVDIQNTGQTEMRDVELSFSGLNSDFYSVSRKDFASIDAGGSRTVQVTFDIPESYGVDDYPELGIDVSAQNAEGEDFTDSDEILAQLTYGSGNETGSAESESPDEEEEGSSFSPGDAAEMTGEFLDSQSSLNIALGLILVFLMALAGAVKKKKNEGNDDRRRGGRTAVQKPSVQKQEVNVQEQQDDEDVDSQIDEIADAFDEEEEAEEDSGDDSIDEVAEGIDEESAEETGDEVPAEDGSGGFKCEVCGEEFDSESGRDLHRQALHE